MAALGMLSTAPATADIYTWTNGSGNRTWDTSLLNWTTGAGNVPWVANNDAVFGSTSPGSITVSGSQAVTSLAFTGTGFTLTGGTIGLASATTSFTATQSGTIGSVITGTNSLLANGTAALVLTGSSTFTGSTLVSQGTLRLAGSSGRLAGTSGVTVTGATLFNGDATAATNNGVSNRINSAASLTLGGTAGGGTYTQVAAATGTHSQSLAGLAFGPGVNVLSPSGATGTNSLTFTGAAASAYTRSPGGTLNILPQTGSIIAFSNLPSITAGSGTDAILPGAAINGDNFAGLAGSGPYTTGTANYVDTSTTTWTAGKNMNVTGSVTPGVATNVNSIRFGSATNYTVTLTGSNVIGSGNILVTSAASTASSTITGGTISSAAMSGAVAELTIFERRGIDLRTGNPLVIGSVIADNGATPLAVTIAGKADGKSGQFNNNTGLVSLTAANTFSGGLSLVSGGVNIAGDAGLGVAPVSPTTNLRVTGISALRVTATTTLNANRTIELNNGFLTVMPVNVPLTIPGTIVGSGTLSNYTNSSSGVLVLTGTNTFSGAYRVGTNMLRADEGKGLSPNANLAFVHNFTYGSGLLQTTGTFSRPIGTGAGQVSWTQSGGGFATNGAPLTIALGGTGSLNTFSWGITGVANGTGIILQGDSELVWLNPIDFGSGATRTITVQSGTAELRGTITGNASSPFTQGGTGALILTASNSYAGKTWISQGTIVASSLNSVVGGAPTSSLGAPTTEADGTIDLGNSTYQGTLRYSGTGETTDRKLNIPSNIVGYGATVDQSGSGLLKFTSNFAATGYGSGKILTLQGSTSGQGEFSGSIADNVSGTTTLTTAFASGTTTITLDSATSIVAGAAVSGVGIAPGTTVSSVNTSTRVVTLSQATTGAAAAGALISVAGVTNPLNITKAGTGLWRFSGTNTYTGNTSITAGVLSISSTASLPGWNAAGRYSTLAGATLVVGDSVSDTDFNTIRTTGVFQANAAIGFDVGAAGRTYAGTAIANPTVNALGLVKLGSGTLSLNVANTYTGTTSVGEGTIRLGVANALPSTSPVLLTGNGSLDIANSSTSGAVTVSGTGSIFGSATLIGASYTLSNTTGTVTVSAILGGTASTLTKSNAGTASLSGLSTYGGVTSVSGGILEFMSIANSATASALGAPAAGVNSIIGLSNGATLRYTGTGGHSTNRTINLATTAAGTATLDASGSGSVSLGSISASGSNKTLLITGTSLDDNSVGVIANPSGGTTSLVKAGSGRWVLSGSNSLSGDVSVNEGQLVLAISAEGGGNGSLGTYTNAAITIGSATGSGAAALLFKSGVIVGDRKLTIPQITSGSQAVVIGAIDGSGTATFGTGTLPEIALGRDVTLQAASNGTMVFRNAWSQASGTSVSVTIGSAGNEGTVVIGQPLAATGSVRIDRGTLRLTALNSSTGSLASAANVVVGTAGSVNTVLDLAQTGSSAAYVFGSNQTLSGIGTIRLDTNTPVSIAGVFSPGNSPGIFTFQGDGSGGTTTLAGTTFMEITGTTVGTTYDQVKFTSGAALNYGGSLLLDISGIYADNTAFQLFDFASTSQTGSFTTISGSGSYGLLTFVRGTNGVWTSGSTSQPNQTFTFTESTGTLVVVPEPATLALAAFGIGLAGWAAVRRRK